MAQLTRLQHIAARRGGDLTDVVHNNQAFQAEDRRLRQGKQWKRLLDLYEARASVLEEPGKERMFYKAGEVATDELGDADLAEQYFMRAFKVRRSFMPAIGALRVLHTNNRNTAGLLQVLNYELEVTSDPRRRAALYVEIAGLLKKRDPEKALSAFFQAIDAHPKSRLPLDELEKLARKLKKWSMLVKAYERLAEAAPSKQAAVYYFLSGTVLDEQMKDREAASAAFSAALEAGPQDARILKAMERHFEKHKDWDGLTKAIWQHLELVKQKKERIELLKRQATIFDTHLKEPARAQRLFQKALAESPNDRAAIQGLFKVSKALEDPRGMAEALEFEGELPSLKDNERADRFERAAFHRDRAKDGKRAYEDIKRSLALRPRWPKALKLMEKITRKLGNWAEHVRVLEEERELLDPTNTEQEKKATLTILRRLAEVSELKLRDEQKAKTALRDIVQIEPGEAQAWDRLLLLARRAENWIEVGEVLQERVDAESEPGEKARRLRELAELRRDQLGDLTTAAEAFEELLAIDPSDLPAMAALCEVYQTASRAEDLAKTLERLVGLQSDPGEKAAVQRQLARVQLEDLDQTEQAKATLREALALEGEDEGGLEAWKLMAKVSEKLDDDDLMRESLAGVKRFEQDPTALRWVRIQLAKLEERAGNILGALGTLEEVLAEAPADTDALPVAVRLLKQEDRLDEAAQRLETAVVVLEDDPVQASQVCKDLARLLEEAFDDPERARQAWRQALEKMPGDEEAFEKVVASFRQAKAEAELEPLLAELAPSVKVAPLRQRMWREQASLAVSTLEDPARAALVYERLLSEAPGDPESCLALRGLYRELERWGDLCTLLEESVELGVEGMDAAGCWRETARVAEDKLEDLPRAANALETVVQSVTDARDPAWDALISIYERLEQHTHRVRVLERVSELAVDPKFRSRRLAEAAAVYETKLRDFGEAASALQDALTATPGSFPLLISLARVHEEGGEYDKAAQVLADAAEAAEKDGKTPPEETSELLVRRGSLKERLGDHEGAEEAYRKAIGIHGKSRTAHEALVQLLDDRGEWDRVETALQAAARVLEGEDQARLLVRRGEILAGRLGKLEDALAVFDLAESARPKLALTGDARVRALRLAQRPKLLVAAIAQRREADPVELSTKELLALLREEAEVRGFVLNDLEAAHALLLEAFKRRSKDVATVRVLLRVERQMGLVEPLADHLEAAALLESERSRRADLLLEAGRLIKTRGDDRSKAKSLLARVLKADPQRIEAVRWLATVAREEGDTSGQIAWLEEEAKLEQEPRRRAVLLTRLGQLQRKSEPKAARAAYERALAEDPQHVPALLGLAPLLRADKAYQALATVLEKLAALEPDARYKVERLIALGDLLLQGLIEREGAREAFEQALQLDPSNLRALAGRSQTYNLAEEAPHLVEALKQEFRATPHADRRVALGRRIARIQLEQLEDRLGAVATLEEVLRLRPLDDESWKQIRDAHVQEQRWGPLAETYEAEARRHPDVKVQEERFRAAAQIYEHHLTDMQKASALYEEVLARGDPHCLAVRVLPPMLLELGNQEGYERALRRIPEIVPRTRLSAESLLTLGKRKVEAGDKAAAIHDFQAALDHDEKLMEAFEHLSTLHEEAGEWPQFVQVLRRKRALIGNDPQVIGLHLEIGKALEEELKDPNEAIEELKIADASAAKLEQPAGRKMVLEWLARLCRQTQRFADLAQVLGSLADLTSRPEKASELLIERAGIERHRLQNARAAIQSYQAAFSRHQSPDSLGPLLELLEAEELWEDFARSLDDRWRLSKKVEERAEALARMAGVLDQKLNRPEDAIAAWERVLDQDPDHRQAFAALEEICGRTENHRAQARALEREIVSLRGQGDPESAERLVERALRAAEIYVRIEQRSHAATVLESAREVSLLDKRVFTQLDQLYSEAGETQALYTLLLDRANTVPDVAEKMALHERLAGVAADDMGQVDAARDHWEQVLGIDKGYPPAVQALEQQYRERESWADLARVMRGDVDARSARAAAGEDAAGEGLADRYLDLGQVLEGRLGKREEAAAAYAEAATRAKGDPRPLRGLERILQAEEAWGDLIRVRHSLRDQATEASERAQLSIGIASAWEQLGKRPEAITALEEALDEDSDDAAVLAQLRRHLLEEQRYEDAAAILAREADVAPERVNEFQRRMERAELVRDRLNDSQEAIAEFERARELSPLQNGPLLALAPLYEAKQDVVRLVDVLEARANLEEEDPAAADLYAQAGKLNVSRDPAAAAASYEKALRRDPLRDEPLDALVELYEAQERWGDLSRTLHRRADLARALGEGGADSLRQAARIEEERLQAKGMAAATLERLLDEDPNDDGALAELARLRGELGDHAAHEVVLGRRAALAEGEAQRSLLLERARILEEKLKRPAAAAGCLRGALATLPQDRGQEIRKLADDLMRLEEAAGNSVGLADAAERALQHARDEEDRTALLRRLGQLNAGPVYRPDRAIAVYRQLYERDPDEEGVTDALDSLYRREAKNEDLVAFFEQEAARLGKAAGGDEQVIRLKYRAAELYGGPLRKLTEAERCYKEILSQDPDQDAARDGLEAIFRAGQMQEPLAALMAERAQRAKQPGEAAQALTEEATVYEQLGDVEKALGRLETALEKARSEGVAASLRSRILRTLIRLYRRQRRVQELAQALHAFSEEEGLQDDERSGVFFELGMVNARDLKRREDAVKAFEMALYLDDQNVPAARGLAAIYRGANDLPKLVGVYEKEAAAKIDKGRLLWLKNQIGSLKERQSDLKGAQQAYREALTLDGKSLVALRGLASVSRKLSDYHQLAPVLEAIAEIAPSSVDRLEARRELARLYEEALSSVEKAVANYRQVLADAPDDRDALRGLARGLRAQGDAAGLVESLEHELSLTQRDEERRVLALEASRLREELGKQASDPNSRKQQLERALELAHLASELAPSDTEAVGFYARVAEELGRWKELADATVRMARSIDDPKRCGWMLRRAAKIRTLRLNDAQGAVEAYRRAVEVDAFDKEAWEALEPLAEQLHEETLLLRVLQQRLQLADKDAKRATAALKLGRHLGKLGHIPQAIDAFVLARSVGRGQQRADALEQLEASYRLAQRWGELAEVIEARAGDGRLPNALELMLERAKILEERLTRHDLAIEVLWKLRKAHPDDQRVFRELERLLSHVGRWTDLVELYETEASRRGRGGYDALVLLGRVARDKLDDPELAANALQKAVSMNPSGLDALESLKELYARIERWSELLDTLRLEIGILKDNAAKEKRLRTAGSLAEDKLGDLATAERFYAEACVLAPRDLNLLLALGRVQEGRGEYEGLVETLAKQLTLIQDRQETARIQQRRGQVLADKLYRPYEAIECYRKVLEIQPQNGEVLVALSDLLRSQHEWEELTSVLQARLRLQPKDALALNLELAQVQSEKLDRPEPALQAAEQALGQNPKCREAIQLQADVLKRWNPNGKNDAALAQVLPRLGGMSEGRQRAEVFLELGALLEKLQQPEPAMKALREAFKADMSFVDVQDELIAVLEKLGRWEELCSMLQAASRASSGFRSGELLGKLGQVLEEKRGDLKEAEKRYRDALKLAPAHLPPLRGLARLLVSRGAASPGANTKLAEELTRLLVKIGKLEEAPAERANAYVRAGDVLRDALGLYGPAQAQYEQALQQSPQSFPALASLAEMTYASQDFRKALTYFDRMAASPELGQDPERAAELLYARSECYEELGALEPAAASLREVLRHRPGHLQALSDLGRLLLATKSWQAALPVFQELHTRTKPPKVKAEHTLTLAKIHGELKARDKALELYRQGLKQLPRRYDAHLALAALLREKEPKEAKRHYEYVLAGESPADIQQARLDLADLHEVVFKDPTTAAGHLNEALKVEGPLRAKAARRLAETHGRAERWKDAVLNLKRAIEFEPEGRVRAELHANMARVLRDRLQDPNLARKCFEQALELNPHDRKTLESLLRLLEAAGDFEAQARVLGLSAAEAQKGGAGDETALRTRRAKVFERIKRGADAAVEYERVLSVDPNHTGARAALSTLYLQLNQVDGLERIHRQLLAQDPFNVGSYQALAEGWRRAGSVDSRGQAIQVLAALRAAQGEDKQAAQAQGVNMPRAKVRIKDGDFGRIVAAAQCQGPLLDFMRVAGHVLLKQLPDDLKSHGIGWRSTRHPIEGDAFPEHYLVKRICDLLGITELDLYWEGKRPEPILAHGKNSPALIMNPEVFAGLSEAEKAFVLGRALGPLKLNLQFFLLAAPNEARKLVLGALKGLDASRSFPGDDEKVVRNAAKAMARATDVHAGVNKYQRRVWDIRDRIDFNAYRQGVLLTAARTGLFVAGGMFPAASAVVNTNMALRGRLPANAAGVIKLFREVPELTDLAQFAVSEGHLALRTNCLRT